MRDNPLLEIKPRVGLHSARFPFFKSGETISAFKVIGYMGLDKLRNRLYRCLCKCGDISIYTAASLKSGNATKCNKCAHVVLANRLNEQIYGTKYMKAIPLRNRKILSMAKKHSHSFIAKQLGICRQRVDQICKSK